jgi:hypothetical protein
LIIDRWVDQGPTEWSGTIALQRGVQYAIVMEYYEATGGAAAQLRWGGPFTPYGLIPASSLFTRMDLGEDDCDSNGIPDECELVTRDCDSNGVIDTCEFRDCNRNGVHDVCDIAAGTSQDCDWSEVPDECELGDGADLAQTLAALNADNAAISNLIPSRFNFSEGAVGNQIADGGSDMFDGGNRVNTNLASDIAYTNATITNSDSEFGTGSQYFTAKYTGLFVMAATNISISRFELRGNNGADNSGNVDAAVLPISVNNNQFTAYVKRVFNTNDPSINQIIVVPGVGTGITHTFAQNTDDGRQTLEGLQDIHHLYYLLVARQNGAYLSDGDAAALATALLARVTLAGSDCNSNSIPDVCEIASGSSLDCTANGRPDECELTDNDCNLNGVPDECDSPDCNGNGAPDECDMAAGSSADCDTDGVPDECFSLAGGLRAVYFDNVNLTNPRVTRIDPVVNFDWGVGAPDPSIGPETFSVRWTGQVRAPATGAFTFYTTTDDGVRLWVNGQLLIDRWIDQGSTEWSGVIALLNGANYAIVMEYFDSGGGARAELRWSGPSTPKELIPSSALFTLADDCNGNNLPDECEIAGNDCNTNGTLDECELALHDCNENGRLDDCDIATGTSQDCDIDGTPDECRMTGGLRGVYYDDAFLIAPIFARTDSVVNFDWGNASPDPAIAPETFSVRWTGEVQAPATGTFTFYTVTDDGVRLWVDGQLLVDDWTDHPPTERSGAIALQTGAWYAIAMEYYEGGGGALAQLRWSGPSTPKQVIPAIRLFPLTGDCNANGTPDECEMLGNDCNFNGIHDACEVVNDCDTNGVPDDCELAGNDCNTNGVHDACELAVNDCDTNGVPDDCELAGNDCNTNGTHDACELAVNDCDTNGVTDDCELAGNDCNTNGVHDACELALNDCNTNGVLDDCDILEGTSLDELPAAGDGVPDECERVHNVTQDTWHVRIQTAIDIATDGDEIAVGPGTYLEAINLAGKVMYLHSRDGATVTAIDASNLFAPAILCNSAEGPGTIVEGFSLIGSLGYSGMQVESGSPTVRRCTFPGHPSSCGSALLNYSASPTVSDCTFSVNDNQGCGGGAVQNLGGAPTFKHCVFAGNFGCRGAMYNEITSLTAVNCEFRSNADNFGCGGGALTNYSSTIRLTNCTFTANHSSNTGGAIYSCGGSTTLTNCILWNDTADFGGNELYGADCGDGFTVTYSNVQGGHPGNGNFDADPLFVQAPGNLRLAEGSPCMDAGTNGALPPDLASDLDGNPRIVGGVVDVGAYEWQIIPLPVPGDLDGDGDVDLTDYLSFADCLAGPEVPPAPPGPLTPQECLDAFDFDADADVDLMDAAGFTLAFTGS